MAAAKERFEKIALVMEKRCNSSVSNSGKSVRAWGAATTEKEMILRKQNLFSVLMEVQSH